MKKIKLLSYPLLILLFIVGSCPAFGTGQLSSQTLSLSCKDADIVDVLRAIALQSGVNIVPDNTVSGKVTIQLSNAPFEAGLRTLLETNGFTYENQDGIYRIHKKVTNPETLQMSVSDGKLSIDARGADVKDVIRQLSTKANINIVADSALSGMIIANFSDVPIEDALEALFSANNYTLYQDANIYRVGSRTSPQKGSFAIFPRKGLVTIDVKNAQAVDVLQELATQMKIKLVIVGNIQGNLTMRLEDVTLETALDMITTASGTAYKKMDSIYVVGDATVKPGVENPLLERKVIWLKHIEAADVMSSLPADIPKTNVTVSQDRNALVIIGTPQTIERIESLLSELDVSTPEIRSRQQFAIWVDVDSEGRISVDVKDAPMDLILRELSIKTGINIALIDTFASSSSTVAQRPTAAEGTQAAPARQTSQPARTRTYRSLSSLSGNVNLRIEDATLKDVLDALFTGTGYTYKLALLPPLGGVGGGLSGEKELYIIGTGELATGLVNPLTISRKIELNYLDVTKVMELLPPTIPDANITLIPDQNAIAVLGTEEMMEFLTSYLKQIDTPTPQVMIEAMLLEVTKGNTKELGLEFGASKEHAVLNMASGIGLVFDSLKEVPEAFDVSLNALLSENKARILASPRVAVLSGQTAFINVGVKYMFQTNIYSGYGFPYEPYQPTLRQQTGEETQTTRERETQTSLPYQSYSRSGFNTIDTGITLDITPWVGNAGEITMTIAPTIRDADDVTSEEARVAERSINTVIRVNDGGMIIIGGLLQEKELTKKDKVPILGSIPLMGRLFSKSHKVENESELIIVIKPRIIQSMIEEEVEDAKE